MLEPSNFFYSSFKNRFDPWLYKNSFCILITVTDTAQHVNACDGCIVKDDRNTWIYDKR